ncbi:hypothetical protein BDW62DRAFT_195332 [Aspergillus aurantiobrunneus]
MDHAMKDAISQVLNQCLRDFSGLTESGTLARYESEVSRRRWLDELGRLRVWSGNIGAHQVGQSSLDYRLRDASHLKGETIKLLNRMLRVLQDVTEVITEDSEEELEIELEDGDCSIDDTTEVQQLYQNIVDIINSLFQISMAIRKPADHDRLLNMRIKNESFFEPWAQQHVSHKYPNAENSVVSRLSAAMARQKAILKYRERHRAKLGKGLFEYIETDSTKLSETVATEMDPGNDQLQFLETVSDSGLSQTSYATSLMQTQAAASIPNPPKGSKERKPFECPYCFHVITIKHKKDWTRHVFRDLMPYVCLSSNCSTPSRLYESRHQWFHHMHRAHSLTQYGLACPLCHICIQTTSFEKHVGRHLEELALFVLPRTDPSEESSSEVDSSAASINGVGDDSDEDINSQQETDENLPDDYQRQEVPMAQENGGIMDYIVSEDIRRALEDQKIKSKRASLNMGAVEEQYEFSPSDLHEQLENIEKRQTPRNESLTMRDIGQDTETAANKMLEAKSRVEDQDLYGAYIPYRPAAFREPRLNSQGPFMNPVGQSAPQFFDAGQQSFNVGLNPPNNSESDWNQNPLGAFNHDGSMKSNFPPRHSDQKSFDLRHPRPTFESSSQTRDPIRTPRESEEKSAEKTGSGGRSHNESKGHTSTYESYYTYTNPREMFEQSRPARSRVRRLSDPYVNPQKRELEAQLRTSEPIEPTARYRVDHGKPHQGKYSPTVKGILRPPREKFPEEPNPVREGVVPLEDSQKKDIPPGARWTKIDRRLVNPAALEDGKERFEERKDYVIVLRVLTKEEIQAYAVKTQEIRDARGESSSNFASDYLD